MDKEKDKIAKYVLKDFSKSDESNIKEIINKSEKKSQTLDKLQKSMDFDVDVELSQNIDSFWNNIEKRIQNDDEKPNSEQPKKSDKFTYLKIAAVFVICIISVFYISDGFNTLPWKQNSVEFKTISVAYGDRQELQLSDGSKIILDAGSSLKYADNFNENRTVYFQGEAFFDVTPDENHPFVIHALHANVKVLGTRFNVRAWDESDKVTVTVTEGKVALKQDHVAIDKSILVSKGEQGIIFKNKDPESIKNIETERFTSWMDNELHFENTSLAEIVYHLNRWYGKTIIVDDTTMLEKQYSIHLKKVNLDEVLKVLSMITDTEIKISQ